MTELGNDLEVQERKEDLRGESSVSGTVIVTCFVTQLRTEYLDLNMVLSEASLSLRVFCKCYLPVVSSKMFNDTKYIFKVFFTSLRKK